MHNRKVCFLCPWMDVEGGLQRVVSNVANQLAEKYEVCLCIISIRTGKPFYPLNPKIKVVNFPLAANGSSNLFVRGIRKNFNNIEIPLPDKIMRALYYPKGKVSILEDFLADEKFDDVIAACGDLSMLLGCIDRKRVKANLFGWQHNSYDAYFRRRGNYYYGREKLAKVLYANLDTLVLLTNRDCEVYRRKFNVSCRYIYNPLSFVSEEKTDINNKFLIFVGRLEREQKGIDYLAEVLQSVFKDSRADGWEIYIVGDGKDRQDFENSIQSAGISQRVRMTGRSSNVTEYYLKSSVFVNTSRWEGFGLVVTEALECGLPVVAFETDGPMEIISDGREGFLIEKFDIPAFAECILKLMSDDKLREEMSKKAVIRAKDFSVPAVLEKWTALFEEFDTTRND